MRVVSSDWLDDHEYQKPLGALIMLPPPPPADHYIEARDGQGGAPLITWENAPVRIATQEWKPISGPRAPRPEDWANIVEAAIRHGWELRHRPKDAPIGWGICQVAHIGEDQITCEAHEGGGLRCEVTGEHTRHRLGPHTWHHYLMGNGYACSKVTQERDCHECDHRHVCTLVAPTSPVQSGFPDGEWMCTFCLNGAYEQDPFRETR